MVPSVPSHPLITYAIHWPSFFPLSVIHIIQLSISTPSILHSTNSIQAHIPSPTMYNNSAILTTLTPSISVLSEFKRVPTPIVPHFSFKNGRQAASSLPVVFLRDLFPLAVPPRNEELVGLFRGKVHHVTA